MILVDSSVWVDYLGGNDTAQTNRLDSLLQTKFVGIGDLNLTEVLQGCSLQKDFDLARRLLGHLQFVVLGGSDVATPAAVNYRKLRSLGVTVRGTVDLVLATRCIVSGYQLLHADRTFDSFERHLGLQCVATEA